MSGKLKGRRVTLPRGSKARPVTGMVQERVMSLVGPDRLENGIFADICAGSGLVGFEAISRGALQTFFVEVDPRQARQLSQTAEEFGVKDAVHVLRTDARRCFGTIIKKLPEGGRLSAVFMDPPYIPGMARDIVTSLGFAAADGGLLANDALAILRTPDHMDDHPNGPNVPGLTFLEARTAGNAKLWLYSPALL